MMTYGQALSKIRELGSLKPSTEIAVHDAIGFVARETVVSPVHSPLFDNSALDGFVVRSEETLAASAPEPLKLKVLGTIAAGQPPMEKETRRTNSAWEVTAGAPLPVGYDAVEKNENLEIVKNESGKVSEILLRQPVPLGQHVRQAGGDFRETDTVLNAGTVIMPEHIMALASLGVPKIVVTSPPKVAIISTGGELEGYQTVDLGPGKIRNSTGPYIVSELKRLGSTPLYLGMVGDDPKVFTRVVEKALSSEPDVIITTGGVSVGRHDFVEASIKNLGGEVHFHNVAVRPGKALLFATFPSRPNSQGRVPAFFGLPGNPVSSVVGMRFFAEPYLRVLEGLKPEPVLQVPLAADLKKPDGLRCFYRARVTFSQSGDSRAEILQGQASYLLRSLLEANAWAILSEDGQEVCAGTLVDVVPLHAWAYSYTAWVGSDE